MSKALTTLAKKHNLNLTVVDDDNNKIEFTEEQVNFFIQAKAKVKNSMIEMAQVLERVQSEKMYLMENYSSFKDFVTEQFKIGARTAYEYLTVHKNFSGLIDYQNYPVTSLLEIAKDPNKMDTLQKARNKENAMEKLFEQLKEEKRKKEHAKDVVEANGGEIHAEYNDFLERARMKNQLLFAHVQGKFENTPENLRSLARILNEWEAFKRGIDPILMTEVQDALEEFQREETEKEERERAEREAKANSQVIEIESSTEFEDGVEEDKSSE